MSAVIPISGCPGLACSSAVADNPTPQMQTLPANTRQGRRAAPNLAEPIGFAPS